MPKGAPNKRYTGKFKQMIVEDKHSEAKISLHEGIEKITDDRYSLVDSQR